MYTPAERTTGRMGEGVSMRGRRERKRSKKETSSLRGSHGLGVTGCGSVSGFCGREETKRLFWGEK